MRTQPLIRVLRGGTVALLALSGAAPAADSPGSEAVPRTVIRRPLVQQGERDGAPVYRQEMVSPVYTIDRIYKSMTGPYDDTYFTLHESGPPELLWVTGYRALMVEPDTTTPMSQEFMCHSNLDVDTATYRKRFPSQIEFTSGRVFTLAQGQLELELPKGFGIPMMSDADLRLNTQVLNHNIEGERIEVRHRISIDFIRDRDLPEPLAPLIQHAVYGLALLEGPDGHFGVSAAEVDPERHGPGCMLGDDAGGQGMNVSTDAQGRKFTGFWVVPPGRQVNHTRVTELLSLPYDTTVHYIAAHLHPFAESIELRDQTAGETVFKSRARQVGKGIGLAEVEAFSSEEGLPLYKDHEYQLISTYDNTTEHPQDSMAVMYLYMRAKDLYDFDFRPRGS